MSGQCRERGSKWETDSIELGSNLDPDPCAHLPIYGIHRCIHISVMVSRFCSQLPHSIPSLMKLLMFPTTSDLRQNSSQSNNLQQSITLIFSQCNLTTVGQSWRPKKVLGTVTAQSQRLWFRWSQQQRRSSSMRSKCLLMGSFLHQTLGQTLGWLSIKMGI